MFRLCSQRGECYHPKMNSLTLEHFAWSFGALCALGIVVNVIGFWPSLKDSVRRHRWRTRIDLTLNLALVLWGVLLFTTLPTWLSQ